jgi:hypothetical protein
MEVKNMNKEWYKSKTLWGGVFLAIEAGLLATGSYYPYVNELAAVLGTFLTVFGFRDAMK